MYSLEHLKLFKKNRLHIHFLLFKKKMYRKIFAMRNKKGNFAA